LRVEITLFEIINDDQVESVFEGLDGDADGLVGIGQAGFFLVAARVDLTRLGTLRDLGRAEGADELPGALAFVERGDLVADNAFDQLAQRHAAIVLLFGVGWWDRY